MEILLNGDKRVVAQGLTLAKLLESLEIRTGSVAVEHNEKVIPRKNLEQVALNSGDKVEIVRFVGGG
ncbi:MAG TPA: thiamine biosynthesis protein ThiS [Candidatus Omnitrophica bacterium]|nr:thiamine biosynthesis protein ThiS [Candidatus Omnitrophota bacterium]